MANKRMNLEAKNQELLNEQQVLDDEDTNLETRGIAAGHARRVRIATRLAAIGVEIGNIGILLGNVVTRQGEYQNLADTINQFDINRNLPDMENNLYNAGADIMKPGNVADTYAFFNEDGKPVNLANYRIDLKLADGTIQNVKINGLNITPAGEINT